MTAERITVAVVRSIEPRIRPLDTAIADLRQRTALLERFATVAQTNRQQDVMAAQSNAYKMQTAAQEAVKQWQPELRELNEKFTALHRLVEQTRLDVLKCMTVLGIVDQPSTEAIMPSIDSPAEGKRRKTAAAAAAAEFPMCYSSVVKTAHSGAAVDAVRGEDDAFSPMFETKDEDITDDDGDDFAEQAVYVTATANQFTDQIIPHDIRGVYIVRYETGAAVTFRLPDQVMEYAPLKLSVQEEGSTYLYTLRSPVVVLPCARGSQMLLKCELAGRWKGIVVGCTFGIVPVLIPTVNRSLRLYREVEVLGITTEQPIMSHERIEVGTPIHCASVNNGEEIYCVNDNGDMAQVVRDRTKIRIYTTGVWHVLAMAPPLRYGSFSTAMNCSTIVTVVSTAAGACESDQGGAGQVKSL